MGETCSRYGQKRYVQNFVGETCGKELLGRSGRRWEEIIKMDFQEVGWESMDLNDLVQDRDRWRAFLNVVMKLWVP